MFRAFIFLYTFLYTTTILLYLPIRLLRTLLRSQKLNLSERLWRLPDLKAVNPNHPAVWIHAVSVGEVNAARPLVDALSPLQVNLFFSTITQTGQAQAIRLFAKKAHIFYMPLDWKLLCRRFLRHLRPGAVLLMETEIWPNFIAAAAGLNIPVVLVNGRISDRSFKSYTRARFFISRVLPKMAHFCMQSKQDADRIVLLGAPRQRVSQTGNLKYDYSLPDGCQEQHLKRVLSGILKASGENQLLICGSTKSGEEGLLVPALHRIWEEFPSFRLLLAPRHPHRGDEVTLLLKEKGIHCLQRSRDELNGAEAKDAQALVLDSIGELPHLYELADLVYMGGSLVPTGGQNPIEAAALGKAILFGPDMSNFQEIANAFLAAGAAVQVASPEEFEVQVRILLKNPQIRERLGENALAVVEENRGAVGRTIGIVKKHLVTPQNARCVL